MLAEWVAPVDVAQFLATHLGKSPTAGAGTAAGATALLDWATLDRVLASDQPLDILTVARGRLVDAPAPRSAADVERLMRDGVSTVVRGSERNDAGLARLAASFGATLPGEVHVQLYATPGGTNSYGWHFDFEDVFIAQTLGVKDYYFCANTVAGEARLGDTLDFASFKRERSPLMSSRLVAGDWLYLPARWWHLVKCAEDSLSISIGVMGPDELANARRLPAGWTGATSR